MFVTQMIFLHVLKQINMPCETLSLCDEKCDVEQVRKPWNIVPASHKIGKQEPLFSEMVLLYILIILLCAHPLKSNQMDEILNYEGGINRKVIFN